MEDFNTSLTSGNVKRAMKDAGAGSSDLWKVPPSQLRVLDGFNIRIKNEAYYERVTEYADSIRTNGYWPHKPLAGYVALDADGNDVIYLTDGMTRYEAIMRLVESGYPLDQVPVVVSAKGTNMEDLTVQLIRGNQGCPVGVYESAIGCKRLADAGWDSDKIAVKCGYKSAQYVDDLLLLSGAPLAIRRMVIEEVIAPTHAIASLKKHRQNAVDVLTKAMVAAGGKHITAKHMPDAVYKKALRKHSEPMYHAIAKVRADAAFSSLSPEVQEVLAQLLAEVQPNQ